MLGKGGKLSYFRSRNEYISFSSLKEGLEKTAFKREKPIIVRNYRVSATLPRGSRSLLANGGMGGGGGGGASGGSVRPRVLGDRDRDSEAAAAASTTIYLQPDEAAFGPSFGQHWTWELRLDTDNEHAAWMYHLTAYSAPPPSSAFVTSQQHLPVVANSNNKNR